MALVVKNLPANAAEARDLGSVPGVGKILWRRKWQLLWYSCLENSMARGTWWFTVHRVAELDTTELNWEE